MGLIMEEPAMLAVLGEKTLPQAVVPEQLAYCPTMDLIALATPEERVYVYRLNGQRVLGLGNKTQGLRIKRLRWKPNGLSQTQLLRNACDESQ